MAAKVIEFDRWTSECNLNTGPLVICPDVSRVPAVNWSFEQRKCTELAFKSITPSVNPANVTSDEQELAKTSITKSIYLANDISGQEELAKSSFTSSIKPANVTSDVEEVAKTSITSGFNTANDTSDEEVNQALLTQLETELPNVLVHLAKDDLQEARIESEDVRVLSFETDSLERASIAIHEPSSTGSQADDIFNTRVESLSDDVFETESDSYRRLGKCQRMPPLDQQSEDRNGMPVHDTIAGDISVIVGSLNNLHDNPDDLTSMDSIDTSFSSGSYTTDLDACLEYLGEVERREEFIISERMDCFEFRNDQRRLNDGDTKRDEKDDIALNMDCNPSEYDSLSASPCHETTQIPPNAFFPTNTDPMGSSDKEQVMAPTPLDSEDGDLKLNDINIEFLKDITEVTLANDNVQCDSTKASQNEGSVDKDELTLNETETIDSSLQVQAGTINTESDTDMKKMLTDQSTILSNGQKTHVVSSSQNEHIDTTLETLDIYSTVRSETENREISINKDGAVEDTLLLRVSDDITDTAACALDDDNTSDSNKRNSSDNNAIENLLQNHDSIDHRGFCKFRDTTTVSLEHDLNQEIIPNINTVAIDEFVSSVINYAVNILTEGEEELHSDSFFEQFALDSFGNPRENTQADPNLGHKEELRSSTNSVVIDYRPPEVYDNVTCMGSLATIPEVDPILESYTLNDILYEVPSREGSCSSVVESEASFNDGSEIPKAEITLGVINDSLDSFEQSTARMTLEEADFKEDNNRHYDDLLPQDQPLEMVIKGEEFADSRARGLELSESKDGSNKIENRLEKTRTVVDISSNDSLDGTGHIDVLSDSISQGHRLESMDTGYDLADSSTYGVNSPECEDDTNFVEGTFEQSVKDDVISNLNSNFAAKPDISDLGILSDQKLIQDFSLKPEREIDTSSVMDGYILDSKHGSSSDDARELYTKTPKSTNTDLPGTEDETRVTKSIHTDFSNNVSPSRNDENLNHTDTDMSTEGSDGKVVGTTSISCKQSDSLSCVRTENIGRNSIEDEGSNMIVCTLGNERSMLSETIQDCQGMASKCIKDDDCKGDSIVRVKDTDACLDTSPPCYRNTDIESNCNTCMPEDQTNTDKEHNSVTATHINIVNLNAVPSSGQLEMENGEAFPQDVDQTADMLQSPEVAHTIERQIDDINEGTESQHGGTDTANMDAKHGDIELFTVTAHNVPYTMESSDLTNHDTLCCPDRVINETVTTTIKELCFSGQTGSNSPTNVAHDKSHIHVDKIHVPPVEQCTEQQVDLERVLPSYHADPNAPLKQKACFNDMAVPCSVDDEIQSYGKDLSPDTDQEMNATDARCNQLECDPLEQSVCDTTHSVIRTDDDIKPSIPAPESPDVIAYLVKKADLIGKDLGIEYTQVYTVPSSNMEDDNQVISEDKPPLEIQTEAGKVKAKEIVVTDTYHKDVIDDALEEGMTDTAHNCKSDMEDIEHELLESIEVISSAVLEVEMIENDADASLHAVGVPCKEIGIESDDLIILMDKPYPENESQECNQMVRETKHRDEENENQHCNAPVENTTSFSQHVDCVTEYVLEATTHKSVYIDSSIDPNTDSNRVGIETRNTAQCVLNKRDVAKEGTADDLQTLCGDTIDLLDQDKDNIATSRETNCSDNDRQHYEKDALDDSVNYTQNKTEKCVEDGVTSNLPEALDNNPNVVQPIIDSSNTNTKLFTQIEGDAENKDIESTAVIRALPSANTGSEDQYKDTDCPDSCLEPTQVRIGTSIEGDQEYIEIKKIPDEETFPENGSRYLDQNEVSLKSVQSITANDHQQVYDTLGDSVIGTTQHTVNKVTCKNENTSNSFASRDIQSTANLKADPIETDSSCPVNEIDKQCTDTITNVGLISDNQENSTRVEDVQSTTEDNDTGVESESEANRKARLLGKILKSNLSGELVRRPEYRQHSRYQSQSLNLEERQRIRTNATQDVSMRLKKAKSFDMEYSRSYPRIYKDLAHRDIFRNASSPKARMSSRYGPPVNRSRSFDGDQEQRRAEHQRSDLLERAMTDDVLIGTRCETDITPRNGLLERTMTGDVLIDTYEKLSKDDVIPEDERRTLGSINRRVNTCSLDTVDRSAQAGENKGPNVRGSHKLEFIQYNSRNYPSDQQRHQGGSNRNTEASADTHANIDTQRRDRSRKEHADDSVAVVNSQEKGNTTSTLSTCSNMNNKVDSVKSNGSQMHGWYERTDAHPVIERLHNGRRWTGWNGQKVTNVQSEIRNDINRDLSSNAMYSKGEHTNKELTHGTNISQRLLNNWKKGGNEVHEHFLKQDSGNGFKNNERGPSFSKRCEGETKRTRSILTNRAEVNVDRQANTYENTVIHDTHTDSSRHREASTKHNSCKAKPSQTHEVMRKRSAFKDGIFQVKRLPSEEGVRQGERPSDPRSTSCHSPDADLKDYINAISLDDVFYDRNIIPYESPLGENCPQYGTETLEPAGCRVDRTGIVNRIHKEKHTSFDEKSIRQNKAAKRLESDHGETVGRSNMNNEFHDFDETPESRQGGIQRTTHARRIPKDTQQRRVLSEKSDVYENTRATSNQVGGNQFSKERPSSKTHDRSLIDRHSGAPSRCFNQDNGRSPRNNANGRFVTDARTTTGDATVIRGVDQGLASTYRRRRGKNSGVISEEWSPARGQYKGRSANDSAMRIHESSEIKQKDGPLSLTDAYGPMDTNDSHTGHALINSTSHLSESMTSLSNRHAPVVSPSRQSTLSKQQSLQSTHSELNGDHRQEEGIKFERLKNLPEEDLMVKIREIIGHMERLEDYHRGDGMRIQKMLGDMYWDYTHMREMIGDCMADGGYGVVSMTMLKTLNSIGIFKNDDVWFPTYYTYNTMWNFTDASSKLAKALSENDAVRLLTLNCGHKPYINAIHSKNVYYVIKASLSILHNIARNSGMKHLFDENKTSETIMPFLESEDEMLKILATLTIANIVDEEENKTIISESGTIHDIVNWIEKAISLPRRRYKGFTPQELTEGLNKLAVNDTNKMRIVEEGALPLFLQMLQHDDIREQSSAARIVWTLSFDKEVRQKINENAELLTVLQKLTESTNKSLQMNCSGALWIIKGDNEVAMEKRPKTNKTKTHVFLSYAWPDKELVLNIRDKLRAEGYAIWIDIEKMGKATLDTMTEAIENSAVVLVCMSEKYKQSPNCRTEAEYTFQLKKDYIPLMMQKKYRPDGWVGTILGAKLYFDFSGKYPFEKSFQGLLKELRGRGKVTPNTTPGDNNDHHSDPAMVHSMSLSSHTSAGTPVHHMPLNSAILNMGQEELIKWLRNTKLTECIPAFMEFDGRLLMQLKIMRTEAPEFFYQCLEKRLNMSLIEILKFTRALEELQ